MQKSGSILIAEFQQPNEQAWEAVNNFVKGWNNTNEELPFVDNHCAWDLILEPDNFHVFSSLVEGLNKLKEIYEIFFHKVITNHYEESDYLTADFTEFLSWVIEAETPFVLNKKEIFPEGGHCSKCGAWDALDHQSEPPLIIINEALLKHPMEELAKPDDEEWDIVYDTTHILISSRFKQILEKNNIKGYSLRPVINHSTGEASKKMFQILAHKSILITALPEGETVQPFCDTCGTAHIPYEYDFAIKKEWIGEDDFFARNIYKGDRLHMSNRVFKLVREHQLTGLWPQAAVAVV